jgi:hypothetical protein
MHTVKSILNYWEKCVKLAHGMTLDVRYYNFQFYRGLFKGVVSRDSMSTETIGV